MSKNLLITTVGTILFTLAATSSAQAVSFSEFDTGVYQDVGSTLDTAAAIQGSPDDSLDFIIGVLDLNTAGLYDADLYKIYLTGGGTFSATITGNASDGNNTPASNVAQLFLFDSAGNGIYGQASTLPANNPLTPLASGEYYLGITQTGLAPSFRPVSSFGRQDFIFDNTRGLVGPKPDVGTLFDFAPGAFRDAIGKPVVRYQINLTGTTPVPEPADGLGLLVIGVLGTLAKLKANKKAKAIQ